MELISFSHYRKKANIAKAKKGDKKAFLSLVDENRLNIYKVARGILSNEQDIEDALQNTVLKAYEKISTLKKDKFFKTWIIRILINECNDILRKSKRITPVEKVIDKEKYHDSYENMDLVKAMNSLNEEFRITTVLFYFDDMSIKDIAEVLEISQGTVKSRLTRSREQLRKVMGEV